MTIDELVAEPLVIPLAVIVRGAFLYGVRAPTQVAVAVLLPEIELRFDTGRRAGRHQPVEARRFPIDAVYVGEDTQAGLDHPAARLRRCVDEEALLGAGRAFSRDLPGNMPHVQEIDREPDSA